MSFDSIINEVKSGKADFGAAGISYTPERSEEVEPSEGSGVYGTDEEDRRIWDQADRFCRCKAG